MADYLLDSNVLILHLREDPRATGLLTQWAKRHALYISVITRTEILAGMRPSEEVTTAELLTSLISLPVDSAIADEAGRLIYRHARRGLHISFPDALIAATALLHELTLVTTNVKHFPLPESRLYSFPPSNSSPKSL